MAQTIRIKGAHELELAFRQMRKEVLRELRPELRAVGEIVRAEAASRFADDSPSSAAGFKVRVRTRGVAVEQSIKRTTGKRPDFGALQMRDALVPALKRNEALIVARVDAMVNRAKSGAGL